jgi:hypothetical protein
MAVKYTSIFPSNGLHNIAKLGFLVLKLTIWQPCLKRLASQKIALPPICVVNQVSPI